MIEKMTIRLALGLVMCVFLGNDLLGQITGVSSMYFGRKGTQHINVFGMGFQNSDSVRFVKNGSPTIYGAPGYGGSTFKTVSFEPGSMADIGTYTLQTGPGFSFSFPGIELGDITSVTPDTLSPGQNYSLTLTGTNSKFTLATGASIGPTGQFFYARTNANFYQVLDDSTMMVNIDIPFFITPGPKKVHTGLRDVYEHPVYIDSLGADQYQNVNGFVRFEDTTGNCYGPLGANRSVVVNPGNFLLQTDANGTFSIPLPQGNYELSLANNPWEVSSTCGDDTVQLVVGPPPYSGSQYVQIRYKQNPWRDLSIYMGSSTLRPGFSATIPVAVSNEGLYPVSNAEVFFNYPQGFTVDSVSNGVSITAQGNGFLNLALPTIAEGDYFLFEVKGTVSQTVPISTVLPFTANVKPVLNDSLPGNNNVVRNFVVTGSFDPNDKQVFTENGDNADGYFSGSDSVLYYQIRFQNTGTDTAFNVIVRDTLDPLFDFSSFEFLGASHPVQLDLKPGGEMAFKFLNIELPDSNVNEPASQGYILYKINPQSGLPLGTSLFNQASIYFDFNAPIHTNQTISTMCPEVNLDFTYQLNGFTVTTSAQTTGTIDSLWWEFGDGGTATGVSASHTYIARGAYSLCLYALTPCGAIVSHCESLYEGDLLVSMQPGTDFETILLAYPNPVKDQLNLVMPLTTPANVLVEVWDVSGRKTESFSHGFSRSNPNLSLDTHSWSSGMYLLRIREGGQQRMVKVLKH